MRDWPVEPVFNCFQTCFPPSACCAIWCAPCNILTWSNALRYAGTPIWRRARFASFLSFVDWSGGHENSPGQILNVAADSYGWWVGVQARRQLARAILDDGGRYEGDSGLIRCCCAPCMMAQETQSTLIFYQRNVNPNTEYGSVIRCACTEFYADGRRVPYPDFSGKAYLYGKLVDMDDVPREEPRRYRDDGFVPFFAHPSTPRALTMGGR